MDDTLISGWLFFPEAAVEGDQVTVLLVKVINTIRSWWWNFFFILPELYSFDRFITKVKVISIKSIDFKYFIVTRPINRAVEPSKTL